MYRITSIAAAIALAVSPAMAWDNTNMGNGQIVDQGGAGAISHSRANARANSNSSARVSGVTGGAGGAGGNASGGAGYGGTGQGGSASATGGNVVVNGGGGGSGGATRAPDIALPSIASGGFDCPTIGIGGGGSGLAGGGGGLVTWISSDCNARKLAETLWNMGHREEAVSILRQHFPEVDKAFSHPAQAAFVPSPWCAKATTIERKHNPGSCGS